MFSEVLTAEVASELRELLDGMSQSHLSSNLDQADALERRHQRFPKISLRYHAGLLCATSVDEADGH